MKFKLDENLDVRLASAMQAKGLDGDTVLSEGLSAHRMKGYLKSANRRIVSLAPRQRLALGPVLIRLATCARSVGKPRVVNEEGCRKCYSCGFSEC